MNDLTVTSRKMACLRMLGLIHPYNSALTDILLIPVLLLLLLLLLLSDCLWNVAAVVDQSLISLAEQLVPHV